MSEGGIRPLVNAIKTGNEGCQEHAAGCLWNLAAARENQPKIRDADAIPVLVSLLDKGSDIGKEAAAGALWNLAANSENKEEIFQAGALPHLKAVMLAGTESARDTASRAVWNMSCFNDAVSNLSPFVHIRSPFVHLPVLPANPRLTNALCNPTWLSPFFQNKTRIREAGIIDVLVNIVKFESESSQEAAARALYSLAVSRENQTYIASLDAVFWLVKMLHSDDSARMDAAAKCWKESGAWDALEQLKHIVTEERGACALDSPRARLSLRAQLH